MKVERRARRSLRSRPGRREDRDRHARRSGGARADPPRLRARAGGGGAGALPRHAGHHRPGDRERLLLRLLPQRAVLDRGFRRDRSEDARDHRAATAPSPRRCGSATARATSFATRARCSRSSWSTPFPEDQDLKIYFQGDWFDLCRGPHMPSTGPGRRRLQADQARRRLLARRSRTASSCSASTAPPGATESELDAYLHMLEEAEKRDHRRIGREMELFHLQEEAPGQVFWHPKGWAIWRALEAYMRRRLDQAGYQEVQDPAAPRPQALGGLGPLGKIPRSHVPGRGRGGKRSRQAGRGAEADELPRPRADLQPGHQVLSRSAAAPCRVRLVPSLRAVRRACTASCACAASRRTTRTSSAARIRSPPKASQFCALLASVYRDLGFDKFRIKFSDRPAKRAGSDAVWDQAEAALMEATARRRLRGRAQSGRGRVLRPEARIRADRRDRPRLAVRHVPGRLRAARAARRDLCRRGRRRASAGDAAPRDPRLVRALHRHPDRGLRRASCRSGSRRCRSSSRRSRPTPTPMRSEVLERLQAAGLRADADLRNEKINYKVREHSRGEGAGDAGRRAARGGGGDRLDPAARRQGAGDRAASTRRCAISSPRRRRRICGLTGLSIGWPSARTRSQASAAGRLRRHEIGEAHFDVAFSPASTVKSRE